MPYVKGESLRDHIDRDHQLPVDEAIAIATAMAEALDYAHRQNVIHRDIKPDNVLMLEGKPVISDFGIALAVGAAGGDRMTETGLSLGTPHYMSPEQATGDQTVVRSTDIYALGAVLYEMLVGEPPYTGATAQAVLGRIIAGELASATKERASVPANVDAVIRKSLEKLPADSFRSAEDFANALADPGFRHGATEASPAAGRRPSWRTAAVGVGVGVLLGASGVALWSGTGQDAAPADPVRFTIEPPDGAGMDFRGDHEDVAISPDGELIVYTGSNAEETAPHVNVRTFDDLTGAPLRGAEGGLAPFVSPDGEWVGFTHYENPSTLQRVSTLGGAPVTLAEAPGDIYGTSWGRDDQIVFGTAGGGLFRIPAGGGEPEALTEPDPDQDETSHLWPSIIDGRGAVVFVIAGQGVWMTSAQLAVLDLDSGEVTRLDIDGTRPRYVSTGHLVYAAVDGSVRAVPFDVASLTVTGSTVPLLEGVNVKQSGAANFDISDDGRLVYALGEGGVGGELSLVWVDRDGREEAIPASAQNYLYPRLSPDGRRVALDTTEGEADDIGIWDFAGETLTRLVLGDGVHPYPGWTPDGERIAYSNDSDIYWKALNNTGSPEILVESPGSEGAGNPNPYFVTPDGAALVFRDIDHPDTNDDLAMISLGDDESVVWRLNGDFIERNAVLSPDVRWMAHGSDESGQFEVYVRPFPQVEGDQVLVSNGGGTFPLWSRDGRELFYMRPGAQDQLMSVSIDTVEPDEAFVFRNREVVMDWPYSLRGQGRNYDVSLDGQRFLALKESGAGTGRSDSEEINVVLNWFAELRERMGN
jgi:serine/threonine-protein kinase